MTRPPDRFGAPIRDERWNELLDTLATNERSLNDRELEHLGELFATFLPDNREDYPHGSDAWNERYYAFADLQAYVDALYPDDDYDLSTFIDDEKDWQQNYKEVS